VSVSTDARTPLTVRPLSGLKLAVVLGMPVLELMALKVDGRAVDEIAETILNGRRDGHTGARQGRRGRDTKN
jgi:hypothetical protein